MSTDFFNEAWEQETSFTIYRLGHQDSTTQSLIMPPELKYIIVMTEEEILVIRSSFPRVKIQALYSTCCCDIYSAWWKLGGNRKCQVFHPSLEGSLETRGGNFLFTSVDNGEESTTFLGPVATGATLFFLVFF